MTSKYSILSVLIRPEIQEKISIGIILIDENNIHFNYSKNKLNIAKSLLSKSAFSSLKDILYSISSLSKNLEISDNKSPFSSSYLEYLSRYNNNILAYSQLKEIELSASDINFQKLFDKYIDSTISISHIEKKPFETKLHHFKKERRKDLQQYFNIDKEITHNEVEGLIVPVSVTFIGQNEVPTFVQSLDFERRTDFLVKDISEIIFLQNAFRDTNKESCAMAITNEPNKYEYPQQHDIWTQLNNASTKIKQFDISEAEAVIDYAIAHNVQPFLNK